MDRAVPVRTRHYRDMAPIELPADNTVRHTRYGEYEAWNFIDGRRSITDIADALYAEFGTITRTDVDDFLRAQEGAGNIRIERR